MKKIYSKGKTFYYGFFASNLFEGEYYSETCIGDDGGLYSLYWKMKKSMLEVSHRDELFDIEKPDIIINYETKEVLDMDSVEIVFSFK